MNSETPLHDYLVISRGHWDKDKPKAQIDTAITEFYDWLNRHIEAGRKRAGTRTKHIRFQRPSAVVVPIGFQVSPGMV